MGVRVAFRPRARGCADEDAESIVGVSNLEPRVRFVQGTTGTPSASLAQCGSGTEFPMQVSMDQLFEIFYRVRLGWLTYGTFLHEDNASGSSGGAIDFEHQAPSNDPDTTELTENDYSGTYYLSKKLGYTTEDTNTGFTLDNLNSTFDAEYTVTGLLGDSDYYARDIKDDERGMWAYPSAVGNHPKINYPEEFRCGYSYYMGSYGGFGNGGNVGTAALPNSWPYSYITDAVSTSYADLDVECILTGRVAYENTAGGTGPFASDAELYLEMSFKVFGVYDYLGATDTILSTKDETVGSDVWSDVGFDFSFLFSSNTTVSCDLYSPIPNLPQTTSYSGTDWVIEAKEWWPYAKPDGLGDRWDAANGDFIP